TSSPYFSETCAPMPMRSIRSPARSFGRRNWRIIRLPTGTPVLYSGVLYVPISSIEELIGSKDSYECCTFRGSVVALDAASGSQIWKSYTISETPSPTTKNAIGTQLYGPSGASVWSSPTIDVRRRRLYVATGNSYSNPPADTSDSLIAFDLNT